MITFKVLKKAKIDEATDEEIDLSLDAAAASILNDQKLRFTRGVNPDGKRWPKSKKSEGQTMVWTGSLLRSLTVFTPSKHQRLITVDPTARNTKTNVPVLQYARAHQLGLGVPKRAFLGINQTNAKEAGKVFGATLFRNRA